jgi:uncharacterized membrane protein
MLMSNAFQLLSCVRVGAERGTVGVGTRITGAVLVGMEWTSGGNFSFQTST